MRKIDKNKESQDQDSYNQRKEKRIRQHVLRTMVFAAFLLFFGFVGLLISLRPERSVTEKRNLTEFPTLTWDGLWDGSFFSDLELWYSDTYPMREAMINAEAAVEDKYGIREQVIYDASQNQNQSTGEDVQSTSDTASENQDASETATDSADSTVTSGSEASENSSSEDTSGEGTITAEPEAAGKVYVADGSAFELFYFGEEASSAYAEMLNNVSSLVGDSATVYTMPVPNSFGIMLSEDVQESLGCDNEGEAIQYIADKLNSDVHMLDLYDVLREHNGEYIYFRTDHHWTQLGAYYAYQVFCEEKGITAHDLSEYEEEEFDGFLGTFYDASNQSSELKDSVDTVYAYKPLSTNDMTYTDKDGNTYDWNIISDASSYDAGNKYLCFIGGDEPFSEIDNPDISDGSTCIVIKDSFGNCFVPFLVDHYDKIYIIDYRSYEGNVTDLVKQQTGSCDIIFANSLAFVQAESVSEEMSALFE
jgi:hypothetical protein